jgi:hypothetical protein
LLVLALLGQKLHGPVASQGLQAVMAVLAATACLRASFRGQAFAKSFWRLAGLAFYLWALAQTLGTYHLYLEAIHPQAGPRGIILYFFSFTPLFAILFLSANAREQETRWETAANSSHQRDFVLDVSACAVVAVERSGMGFQTFHHRKLSQLFAVRWIHSANLGESFEAAARTLPPTRCALGALLLWILDGKARDLAVF